MEEPFQRLSAQAGLSSPPALSRWNPPLCGDIDIHIRADGSWWHEGEPIRRAALVRLFSSILRRERDGEYYLVSPVEKWRISIATHALQVIDLEHRADTTAGSQLHARCASGQCFIVDAEHPLAYAAGEHVPHLCCDFGLTASLARPVWYRLVEEAQPAADGSLYVSSGTYRFRLRESPPAGQR